MAYRYRLMVDDRELCVSNYIGRCKEEGSMWVDKLGAFSAIIYEGKYPVALKNDYTGKWIRLSHEPKYHRKSKVC